MAPTEVLCGRVAAVRLRGDGSYAVTVSLGPGRVAWMVSHRPLRYGKLIEIAPASTTVRSLDRRGQVVLVEGGSVRVVRDAFARRVVRASTVERVRAAMRRPLYAYQAEGAAWLVERLQQGRGAVLADEPGLGKTVQALAAIIALGATPFIVVAPASGKMAWLREARYTSARLRLCEVEGRTGLLPAAHGYVLNYELLRPRYEQLKGLRARALVLDEAHAIKEPNPGHHHRAAVATGLGERIGRVIMLTGSPLLNRAHEWWRLLHLADGNDWPDYDDFRERYCLKPADDEVDPGTSIVTSHGEVHRVEELQTLSDKVVLRRLKADLLKQLPPKRRRSVLCELGPYDRGHYDVAEKSVVNWLRRVRSDVAARAASKNEALVKLTMLRHIAAVGKLRHALPEFLSHWFRAVRAPLVIFAYHADVIRGANAICSRLGLRTSGITGKTPAARRAAEVDRFTLGEADVFIAPIRAAGVSLNLQVASHCLFLERLWTPSLMGQAEDRLHRIGQEKRVEVVYLDAARTVDQYIARVTMAKQRLIDRVIDSVDEDEEQRETESTLEEVLSQIVPLG